MCTVSPFILHSHIRQFRGRDDINIERLIAFPTIPLIPPPPVTVFFIRSNFPLDRLPPLCTTAKSPSSLYEHRWYIKCTQLTVCLFVSQDVRQPKSHRNGRRMRENGRRPSVQPGLQLVRIDRRRQHEVTHTSAAQAQRDIVRALDDHRPGKTSTEVCPGGLFCYVHTRYHE